jgi:hypothetical protein
LQGECGKNVAKYKCGENKAKGRKNRDVAETQRSRIVENEYVRNVAKMWRK